jgi:uncharacterized protein (DUF608 family)
MAEFVGTITMYLPQDVSNWKDLGPKFVLQVNITAYMLDMKHLYRYTLQVWQYKFAVVLTYIDRYIAIICTPSHRGF